MMSVDSGGNFRYYSGDNSVHKGAFCQDLVRYIFCLSSPGISEAWNKWQTFHSSCTRQFIMHEKLRIELKEKENRGGSKVSYFKK